MGNKLSTVSMNGRMAYVIMCVEAYLVGKYPDRDWSIISRKMWQATSMNWADWSDMFSSVIPDVLLQYPEYRSEDFDDTLSEREYSTLTKLYAGITNGIEDDPSDELNYVLNKPFEMAMVYEGTVIGDGKESFGIIEKTEQVLAKNGITLPDYTKVLFSSAKELNGWGNDFGGEFLSIILNQQAGELFDGLTISILSKHDMINMTADPYYNPLKDKRILTGISNWKSGEFQLTENQ